MQPGHVLGRAGGAGVTLPFGQYRAPDGSSGASVGLDAERPHVGLVVGKRGSGKSYTLGVLAEGVARARGVTGVVVDTMGVFGGLAEGTAATVATPRVPAGALPPPAWCDLFDVDPSSAVGTLLWRAAAESDGQTVGSMVTAVDDLTAAETTRHAARNYLALADEWGVFGDGEPILGEPPVTVLDLSGFDRRPMNAVVRAVATRVYERAAAGTGPLPWLLVDEAHVFTDGVAAPALRRLLTRGRHPGASLVLATQRPSALPAVAHSQSDLLVAHRLTAEADLDALATSRPTYVGTPLAERLPTAVGDAVVVDDATESVHPVTVRERRTSHGGASPRASDRVGH